MPLAEPIAAVRALWDERCVPAGCALASPSDPTVDLARMVAEHPDLEWWEAFCQRVTTSAFLCGKSPTAPHFKASLSWLLRPDKFKKFAAWEYHDNRAVVARPARNQALRGANPAPTYIYDSPEVVERRKEREANRIAYERQLTEAMAS